MYILTVNFDMGYAVQHNIAYSFILDSNIYGNSNMNLLLLP